MKNFKNPLTEKATTLLFFYIYFSNNWRCVMSLKKWVPWNWFKKEEA
jgi:hypothetical protein